MDIPLEFELHSKYAPKLIQHFGPKEGVKLLDHYVEDLKHQYRDKPFLLDPVSADIDRLIDGEPLAYVTGVSWFYGFPFCVDKNVLIPRPETEELVHWVFTDLKSKPNSSILDIGTGSGCIAIMLSKLLKTKIDALDISAEALKIAQTNASQLGADVQWQQIDILAEMPHEKFDILVSNPPYIDPSETNVMDASVIKYEPHIALYEPSPIAFYRRILEISDSILNPIGEVYFELNEFKAEEVAKLGESLNFSIELRADMQGKLRMMKLSKNG